MNLVFAFGRLLLAAVLLYAVSPANAQSVSVLEFAGIRGDVTLKEFSGAIAVDSFSLQQSLSVKNGPGPPVVGMASFSPIVLTRSVDNASLGLMDLMLASQRRDDWKLSVVEQNVDGTLGTRMTLELCDVAVSSFQLAGAGETPFEQVAFVYGGYRLGVAKIGPTGLPTGAFEFTRSPDQTGRCRFDPTPDPRDTDGDGTPDANDNCPNDWNPSQANSDGDSLGDACDPDDDNDGFADDVDVFPRNPAEWLDNDGDGIGDNADPDDDNDGRSDVEEIRDGTDPLQRDCAPGECPNSTFNIILMIEARKAAQEKLE
jgi:type VI protein secretion system component Hcp